MQDLLNILALQQLGQHILGSHRHVTLNDCQACGPQSPKAIKTNQFSMVNLPCSDPLNFLQPSLFVCGRCLPLHAGHVMSSD